MTCTIFTSCNSYYIQLKYLLTFSIVVVGHVVIHLSFDITHKRFIFEQLIPYYRTGNYKILRR